MRGGRDEAGSRTRRLFFAVSPDAASREALRRLQAEVCPAGARRVRPAGLHLTLVFLGDCDEATQARLAAAAAAVAVPPFELVLDRTGTFRSGVLWTAPTATPEPLAKLAAALASAARAAGVATESRPFRPHLTLARHAAPGAVTGPHPPVAWRVSEFALYASRLLPSGAVHERVGAWPLRATGSAG